MSLPLSDPPHKLTCSGHSQVGDLLRFPVALEKFLNLLYVTPVSVAMNWLWWLYFRIKAAICSKGSMISSLWSSFVFSISMLKANVFV